MKSFSKTIAECKQDLVHVWANEGMALTARIAMVKAVRTRLIETGAQCEEVMEMVGLTGIALKALEA